MLEIIYPSDYNKIKMGKRTLCVSGYAKNKRDNIPLRKEKALKMLAKHYFSFDKHQIAQTLKAGELIEV